MKRKWLAIGIIVLFVGIAFSPAISAYDYTIFSKAFSLPMKDDMVSITVLEYKPDGTIGKSIVKLSTIQVESLRAELNDVKGLDKQLSIYKKYNLIPQDATAEKLRLGMEEKAQRLGVTNKKIKDFITKFNSTYSPQRLKFFCMNFKCIVEGSIIMGLRFLGGTSFFTSVINFFSYYFYLPLLKSIDLFQIYMAVWGTFMSYNGTLPDSYIDGLIYLALLFGFVGYVLLINPPLFIITIACLYSGYAVASICFDSTFWVPPPPRD